MDINVAKDIIVPIIIGVLSSVLFLLLASKVTPRLVISPNIGKMPPGFKPYSRPGYSLGVGYVVKVVNKSKRTATEVKARLAIVRTLNVGGGQINQTDDFALVKDFVLELPGRKKEHPEDSAFRFITYEPIEQEWGIGNNYIQFSLSAKDHLTGFSKVFSQSYYFRHDAMKDGVFKYGDSMEITPVE